MNMASINDAIGLDGVLRTLLSKILNNKPVVVYPHTSADVVKFQETTVEARLLALIASIDNISTVLKFNSKKIESMGNSMYDKDSVNDLIAELSTKIESEQSSIIQLNYVLENLSVYNKSEIDQKILTLSQDSAKSLEALSTLLAELSSYLNSNYSTNTDLNLQISAVEESITNMRTLVNTDLSSSLLQYYANISDLLRDTLDAYYTKEEVDNQTNDINSKIKDVQDDISELRGENITMNTESVTYVNEHTDSVQQAIIQASNAKIDTLKENVESKMDNQLEAFMQALSLLTGSMNALKGSLVTDLNNVYSKLRSQLISIGGNDSGVLTYKSADEEVF